MEDGRFSIRSPYRWLSCYMFCGLKIPAGARLLQGVILALLPWVLAAQSPTLVLPKDKIVTAETSLSFEWNSIANASGYKIQIDKDDSLFTVPLRDVNTGTTTYTTSLTSGKYFWRVSANTGSGFNTWSAVWSFRVFSPSDLN